MIITGFGSLPYTPDEWWPTLVSSEYADFSYDATNDVTVNGVVDPIVTISFVAKPSGAGEVVASRLILSQNTLVTVWLTGGVPGRVYLYVLTITTAGGRIYTIEIGQECDPLLQINPIPPSPVPGFGTALTWP